MLLNEPSQLYCTRMLDPSSVMVGTNEAIGVPQLLPLLLFQIRLLSIVYADEAAVEKGY